MSKNKLLTFKVTVEYTCRNMVEQESLLKDFEGDALKCYKYISDDFKDSPYNFSSEPGKVINVEVE